MKADEGLILHRVSLATPTDLSADGGPLLAGGFVYGMVVQHEHQHDETMLAPLQLMGEPGYRPLAAAPPGVGGWRDPQLRPQVVGTPRRGT